MADENLKMSRPLPRLMAEPSISATTSTNPELFISPRKLPSINTTKESRTNDNVAEIDSRTKRSRRKSNNPRLKPVRISHELLHDLQEDMVDIIRSAPHVIHPQTTAHHHNDPQPIGKLFIEHERKFKLATDVPDSSAEVADCPPKSTALGLSLAVYKHVSTIILALCGILAGFSLWHCIMVYMLTMSSVTIEDFVQHYSVLSYPAQGMYNFLIAVSTAFLLEKCDVGEMNTYMMRELAAFGISFLSLLCFIVTLVLHHSVVDIEDALSLRDFNITRFQSDPMLISSVWTWRNVCLCRCLAAVLGWLLLCKSLRVNRLEKRLQNLTQ